MAHYSVASIKKHPILLFFSAIWFAEAGMNTLYGFNWGRPNSVPSAILYGGIFFSFACIGTWLATKWLETDGWKTPTAIARRIILAVPVLACLALSQITGWSVLGITLADGSVVRETKATIHATRMQQLDTVKSNRAKLGDQPDPEIVKAKIEAKFAILIKKEKKTVGELTNECKEPDWAPTICREVKDLQSQLAAAKSAKELDAAIESKLENTSTTEKVAAGNTETSTIRALTGATDDTIKFWLSIFIVAMIGTIATLGLPLAIFADRDIASTMGIKHDTRSERVSSDDSHSNQRDRSQTSYPSPYYPAPLPSTVHHHYPPQAQSSSAAPTPVNVTLHMDAAAGKVTDLRPPVQTSVYPVTAATAQNLPPEPSDFPRFLQEVDNPDRPFYVKILTHLQVRPDLYLNLSRPCRVLANTSAMAFQRYVRTLPMLHRELQGIEMIATNLLREVADIMIADVKTPDDHARLIEIQDDVRRHIAVILLLPNGPYERGMLQVVEDLERTATDPRALDYIKRLRHAVATNDRATDADWRTLYQALS